MADVYERALALLRDAKSKVTEAKNQFDEASFDSDGIDEALCAVDDAIDDVVDQQEEASEPEDEG